MQFDNSIMATSTQQDDTFCENALSDLLLQLANLPASERGRLALALSAKLTEFAAFELAGKRRSAEVGELIEMAARLSEQADDTSFACSLPQLERSQAIQ